MKNVVNLKKHIIANIIDKIFHIILKNNEKCKYLHESTVKNIESTFLCERCCKSMPYNEKYINKMYKKPCLFIFYV